MIRLRSILILLIMASGGWIEAQTAPNFLVTDSWGNTHRLYEDYLDQGKTVVIKVFFVNCPPCNAIAPYLEPLYQSWGGGQADVQFIELSILQSDTDAKINVYKNNHNTTFPAVGGQGGSVAAVAPYKSGVFGVYTGTPTFVVIAPDKTVHYDVYGPNIQGTIDALDAAISATGAQGINSATAEPVHILPLSLLSNLVESNLVLNYKGEPTLLNIALVNLLGQIHTSTQILVEESTPTQMDVSSLSDGLWLLSASDTQSNIMASYLFIKQ